MNFLGSLTGAYQSLNRMQELSGYTVSMVTEDRLTELPLYCKSCPPCTCVLIMLSSNNFVGQLVTRNLAVHLNILEAD